MATRWRAAAAALLIAAAMSARTAPEQIEVLDEGDQVRIRTSALEAAVRKRGYVSGVAAGSLLDRKSGFRDAGFGLDIVDWIMEPGSDEAYRDQLAGDLPYLFNNSHHGKRAKRSIEHSNEQAELSAYDQVLQALTSKHAKAVEIVKGARRIAENTPIQLSAARDTEIQARARYRASLATVVEVADAQQLVVQAAVDDAVARLGVWRSLLLLANARGDIGLFLNLVRASEETTR